MICQFTGQPCQYINCPLWDEGRQRCLFHLAIFKILELPAAAHRQGLALTWTEKNIVALMALGHHNKQIADELNIPVKTVSKYVSDILERLDARTRAHAVSIALQRSIVTLPEDHAKEKISG